MRVVRSEVLQWREVAAASALVGAVALLRGWGFEGLVSNDNVATWLYAWREVFPALVEGRQPATFHWPPLYPWLVGSLLWLFGDGAGTLSARSLSALGSLIFVLGTCQLGLSLGLGRGAARCAALWTASGGLFWQSTIVVAPDALSYGFVLWGFVAVLWALRRPLSGWSLAGLLFGLALLSRWAVLISGLTVAALWSAGWCFRHETRSLGGGGRSRWVAGGLLGAAWFGAAAALLAWARLPGPGIWAPEDGAWSAIWSPSAWLSGAFETRDGTLVYGLPNLAYYLLAPLHPSVLGLGALLVPWGLWDVWLRGDVARKMILLLLPATTVLFLAGFEIQNPRFVLLMLAPLALSFGHGTMLLAALLDRRCVDRRWLLAVGVLSWLWLAGAAWQRNGRLIGLAEERIRVCDLALQEASGGRPILSFEITPFLRWRAAQGSRQNRPAEPPAGQIVELHDVAVEEILQLVRAEHTVLLLHDPVRVASQWAERPAGRNLAALEEAPGLQLHEVGRVGRWLVQRVEVDSVVGSPVSDRRSLFPK